MLHRSIVSSSSSFIMFTVSLLLLVACLALPSSAIAARSARSVRSALSPSAADDEAGHSRSVMTRGGDATVEQPQPLSSSSSSEQHQPQRRSSGESLGFASLRECASACFNCVDLFGKDVYDGRKCIHGCGFTRGRTVDYDCSNTAMHILARAR